MHILLTGIGRGCVIEFIDNAIILIRRNNLNIFYCLLIIFDHLLNDKLNTLGEQFYFLFCTEQMHLIVVRYIQATMVVAVINMHGKRIFATSLKEPMHCHKCIIAD